MLRKPQHVLVVACAIAAALSCDRLSERTRTIHRANVPPQFAQIAEEQRTKLRKDIEQQIATEHRLAKLQGATRAAV